MKNNYLVTDGNETHCFTSKKKAFIDFADGIAAIDRFSEHDKKGMYLQVILNETDSGSGIVLKEKKY